MQLYLVAFIVSIGLRSVRPSNEVDTDSSAIQEDFHNFFDSIRENNLQKTETYRKFLAQEAVREQQAFDLLKDELQLTQERNTRQQRNLVSKSGDCDERVRVIFKREANKTEKEPGKSTHRSVTTKAPRVKPDFSMKRVDTILRAAARNDLNKVKKFVEVDNVAPGFTNTLGQTAAHTAGEKGNLEVVRYLLAKDPNLANVSDGWSQTLLHVATQNGSLELVKFLVEEYKMNPEQDMGEAFGDSSVHIAAEKGHLPVFKYFIGERKADVNLKNHLGQPPAFTAALHARLEIVKYIVEVGHGDMTVIDSLGGHILYKSAMKGDLTIPKYLLDERNISLDINNRDTFGETIVHRATRLKKIDFVEYFVQEKHANVNLHDHGGRTPLHLAAGVDSLILVQLLVRNGADVLAKNERDEIPEQDTENERVAKFLQKEAEKRKKRTRRSVPSSLIAVDNCER